MKIWAHQDSAVKWMLARIAGILHHGMGSGKTRTTLELLRRMGVPARVLVCCPKAVMAAWAKQVRLWNPEYRVVVLDHATKEKKLRALAAALADLQPVIIVCNYESAWRMPLIEKTSWGVLVWDEIHRLKSPSGRASRWAGKMATKNPDAKKVGLTGTLIPHSILDVWAEYRAIESPICQTFGTSHTLHRANYAILNPHVPGMVVGYKNLPVAQAKIAATTHRVRSEDVLDLPPIQFIDEQVDLTPPEASLYTEVEKEWCAVCEQGTVTPTNALVQLLRMQQICGGFVRFDGEGVARKIAEHPAKATRLADMLEDLPHTEPVVIFCRFRSDIESATAAAKATGRTTSELSGSANQLAQWQAGDTSTLVTQIQSGGIGIDLTRASYAVFFSLGYSLAEYEQAVARLHRPGQAKRTLIYHLIATHGGRSTVDGRVYECLRERKEVVRGIIDGYRSSAAAVSAR